MEDKVLALVQQNPETLAYLGKIYEKDKLQAVYAQNSIFAMPSLAETFGLVYVEAMSQGLSVLYTKGEGIDGLFEEHIGEAVTPKHSKGFERIAYSSRKVSKCSKGAVCRFRLEWYRSKIPDPVCRSHPELLIIFRKAHETVCYLPHIQRRKAYSLLFGIHFATGFSERGNGGPAGGWHEHRPHP